MATTEQVIEPLDRDETIARIRAGLRKRTGKSWSVRGHRGTAWGWITIASPPARMDGYTMRDSERVELAAALGLERVHQQGESVPSSGDYYREYVDRAEGRTPTRHGKPYWD